MKGKDGQRGGIITRLIALLVLILFCWVLYLMRAPLLRLAGDYLVVKDPLQVSDAIIILSDDDYQADRAAGAADLYRAGWAPRIIASGRALRPYISIADLMKHDLELRGVPDKSIVEYTHMAQDTLEELSDLENFTAAHGWHKLIIVTSNYHTRRARYLARHIFPAGFDVRIEPVSEQDFNTQNWWQSRDGLKLFFHEFVGMTVAMWEVHHLKPATTTPQALLSPSPEVSRTERAGNRNIYTMGGLYYIACTALIV